MNTFQFKCKECSEKYTCDSMDASCEEECPNCGTWNGSEKNRSVKKVKNTLKTKKESLVVNKMKPFKKGEAIGKLIIFQGSATASLGDKVDKVGKVVMLKDNSTNEYDPKTGEEVTNYIPGFTSKIVHLDEFARILKNNEATFEGEKKDLQKFLKQF